MTVGRMAQKKKIHFDWYLVQKRPNGIMLFVLNMKSVSWNYFCRHSNKVIALPPCMCTCVKWNLPVVVMTLLTKINVMINHWNTGSIGSAVRATTVDAKTTPIWTSVSVLSLMSWSQSSEDMTLNSQSVYSVAQPSSGRQNSGGGRRQSSNVFVTTAAWIYNHLQPSCYTTAGEAACEADVLIHTAHCWA